MADDGDIYHYAGEIVVGVMVLNASRKGLNMP